MGYEASFSGLEMVEAHDCVHTPGRLDHPAWGDFDCGSGLLLPRID